MFYRPFLAVSFDENCSYACRACLPSPHLTFDGYVSACDMAYHKDTPLQDFLYGKWNSKDKDKFLKILPSPQQADGVFG